MARMSLLSSPLLLGFEEIERLIDRVGKSGGDGYPPYNIERVKAGAEGAEILRITLAVAGFAREQLDVTLEDNQLMIRGRAPEDKTERDYLYRGIAARQFQRSFVLADGIEVKSADLANGLLLLMNHDDSGMVSSIAAPLGVEPQEVDAIRGHDDSIVCGRKSKVLFVGTATHLHVGRADDMESAGEQRPMQSSTLRIVIKIQEKCHQS